MTQVLHFLMFSLNYKGGQMKPFFNLFKVSLVSFLCSSPIADNTNGATSEEDISCILSGKDNECLTKSDFLGYLDLAAPTNPLFTLMGSTPENVITPKTGDEIMFSFLPRAIDSFGEDNFAIALEVNPGLIMIDDQIAVADLGLFEDKPIYGETLSTARFLSLLSFTLVANRKTGDIDTTQYGIGLSYNYDTKNPLINNDDYRSCVSINQSELNDSAKDFHYQSRMLDQPLLDLGIIGGELEEKRRTIKEKLARLTSVNIISIISVLKAEGITFTKAGDTVKIQLQDKTTKVINLTEDKTTDYFLNKIKTAFQNNIQLRDLLDTKITRCLKQVSKWNRDVFAGGLAAYRSDTTSLAGSTSNTSLSEGDATGFGAWLSLAFETSLADRESQFIVHARYNDDLVRKRRSDDGLLVERVDLWSLGGRYTHQLSTKSKTSSFDMGDVRGFFETAYFSEEFNSMDDNYWQAGIGAEIQIRDGLYFQFVFGDTFDSDIERSAYLSGQFKWSLSKITDKI
jgi:hypothetical protein